MRRFTRRDGRNTVQFFRTAIKREWRWRCFSANGLMTANSGESYHNRADARGGWESLRAAPDSYVENWPD